MLRHEISMMIAEFLNRRFQWAQRKTAELESRISTANNIDHAASPDTFNGDQRLSKCSLLDATPVVVRTVRCVTLCLYGAVATR
jgi:hypothetical protein